MLFIKNFFCIEQSTKKYYQIQSENNFTLQLIIFDCSEMNVHRSRAISDKYLKLSALFQECGCYT